MTTLPSVTRDSPRFDAGKRLAEGLAVPAAASAACFAIILAAGVLAGMVPAGWDGNWTAHVVRLQPHFVDRFSPFDAVWYRRIATEGYVWDPAHGDVKQDVAFFPLWPLLLRLVAFCFGQGVAARWVELGFSAAFGFASICAFDRLARRLLTRHAATTATFLFALYPGASFLLLSYPTGLMNLLCILALLALMDGRLVVAASCAGLVTAIGPLGLGTALTVCVFAAERLLVGPVRWRNVVTAAGIAALSVSGLAGFLVWQQVMLGDALAFIKAQDAWAIPLPWLARIPHAAVQLMIVPDFFAALGDMVHTVRAPTLVAAQAAAERALHSAWLGVALVAVGASAWLRCRAVLLQGVFTMALFIWFHSVSRPGNSALRLTYCTIGIFLGLAWLLRNRPIMAAWVTASFGVLLAGGAFLSAAGYHVV